jgi:drug/metabolite transporter (DMT)-like permease
MSNSTPNPNRTTALILFIGLTLIWGTSFILIKQGLKVFSPDEVGALRVASASIFLMPLAFMKLKELQRHHYFKLFLTGMIGIFIPAFLFATAQTRMDSSVAGIMNTLTPIFTMIISAIVFKIRFKTTAIIGILIGLGGAVILSISRSDGHVGSINLFALLIVLACFFYGSNLNLIKYKIPDLGSLTITSVSLLLTGPLAIVYLIGFSDLVPKLTTAPGAWHAFGFIVLLGCMSTAVATILFNRLVKISTPLFASSVTYAMPIVAVMWGLLDGELLALGHIIGMIAIIGGVYLANRK